MVINYNDPKIIQDAKRKLSEMYAVSNFKQRVAIGRGMGYDKSRENPDSARRSAERLSKFKIGAGTKLDITNYFYDIAVFSGGFDVKRNKETGFLEELDPPNDNIVWKGKTPSFTVIKNTEWQIVSNVVLEKEENTGSGPGQLGERSPGRFGQLTPPPPFRPPPPPRTPREKPKDPTGKRKGRRKKLPSGKTNLLDDKLKGSKKKNIFPSKVQWKQKDKYITYNLNTGKKKEFDNPQGIGVNKGTTPEETLKVIQKKNKRPKFVSTVLGSLQIIVSSPEVVTLRRINNINNINRRFNFRR